MGRKYIARPILLERHRDKSGGPDACWPWVGYLRSDGYARLDPWTYAHRFAYELVNGPIPKGLVIDHLCRNRRCLNPAHMEAVTGIENVLRGASPWARNAQKTLCKRGHPLIPRKDGGRHCLTCHNALRRQHRAERAAAASYRLVEQPVQMAWTR